MDEVERWRASCDPHALSAIDALRAIAREAGPKLTESIKWNAPSFAQDGEDRITLGVERKGGVRAVLHRGAAKGGQDLAFEDEDGLARWPTPDRGVLTFPDREAVEGKRDALVKLLSRWLSLGR